MKQNRYQEKLDRRWREQEKYRKAIRTAKLSRGQSALASFESAITGLAELAGTTDETILPACPTLETKEAKRWELMSNAERLATINNAVTEHLRKYAR